MRDTADRRASKLHRAEQAFTIFGNGCRGKRPYTSKRRASGAIRILIRDGAASPTRINAYRCRACRHWHIGNSAFPLPQHVAEE